jgi:hypothetical protein
MMMEVPPAYAINRGSAAIVGSSSFLFNVHRSEQIYQKQESDSIGIN